MERHQVKCHPLELTAEEFKEWGNYTLQKIENRKNYNNISKCPTSFEIKVLQTLYAMEPLIYNGYIAKDHEEAIELRKIYNTVRIEFDNFECIKKIGKPMVRVYYDLISPETGEYTTSCVDFSKKEQKIKKQTKSKKIIKNKLSKQ